MTEEVRNKINDITLDDLAKIEQMDIASPERAKAIDGVKTLVELNLKDAEACTKAFHEEQLVKTEAKKTRSDWGKTIIGAALGFASTAFVIVSGQKGWFIDKTALGTISKKW